MEWVLNCRNHRDRNQAEVNLKKTISFEIISKWYSPTKNGNEEDSKWKNQRVLECRNQIQLGGILFSEKGQKLEGKNWKRFPILRRVLME